MPKQETLTVQEVIDMDMHDLLTFSYSFENPSSLEDTTNDDVLVRKLCVLNRKDRQVAAAIEYLGQLLAAAAAHRNVGESGEDLIADPITNILLERIESLYGFLSHTIQLRETGTVDPDKSLCWDRDGEVYLEVSVPGSEPIERAEVKH